MDLFTLSGKISLDSSGYELGVRDAIADGRKLSDQLDDTKKSAKGLSDTFKSVLSANFVGDFLKSGISAASQFAAESVALASDLQEVQNVVDVTFGTDSKRIDRWAKQAKSSFGMGELAAKQYSGTIGAMLKSMGLSSEKVTGMSEQLVQLTGDMASFYNLDHETAFEKIRAGISGETEPLKQLGINMSVANLESFAMANGIETAYEKMTQSEQATLRYNYLLSATADAQGDFKRTSDGYANNARLFEENVNSLKTNIGEVFLPIINEAISAVNGLFDAFDRSDELPTQFAQIDSTLADNIQNAEDTAERANALISILEGMESDGEISADEQERWNTTLQKLVQTVPELSSLINLETGAIEGGTKALRQNTEEITRNAIEKAKRSALAEKQDALAEKVTVRTDVQIEYDVAQNEMQSALDALYGHVKEYADKYGLEVSKDITSINDILTTYPEAPDTWYGALGFGRDKQQIEDYEKLIETIGDTYGYYADAQSAAEEYGAQLETLDGEIQYAKDDLDLYGEAIYNTMSDAADATGQATEKVFEMTEVEAAAYKKLETSLQEIQDYRKQSVDSARAALDSLVDGFDPIVNVFEGDEEAVKASLDDMFSGLEDQKQYFDDYSGALQKAAEKGVSEGLLAQLSDGSQQSAAYLQAINDASAEKIAEFNAKWQETEEAKNTLTQVMSDAQLAVDDEYQTMLTNAQELTDALVEAFDRGDDTKLSGLATAQGLADGLAEGEAEITERVTEINGLLGQLAAGSYAYVRANAANAIAGLSGPALPATTSSNADGLSYVPYNDYLSYLHKGEAVLTAAQAEDWRAGRASGATGAGIDTDAIARAVASAISGLSVQMDGQTVGHIVAPTVSADIAEGARTTRRYAMA